MSVNADAGRGRVGNFTAYPVVPSKLL